MPSSRCRMKWILVCLGVSARFLHGFKTCKGCKSLQNRTKGAETPSSKLAMYRREITVKRNFQKLRESPGVRYESVARGSHPIGMSNVEAVRECREIERFHGFFVFSAWHAGSFAPCPKTAPFPEKLHNPREHFRTKTAEKRSRGLLLFCAFTPSHPAFAAGGTPAQTSQPARAHS